MVLSQLEQQEFDVVRSISPTLFQGIPVIDLSNPDSKSCLVKACEDFGFFKVINHSIPTHLISNLELQAIKFFSLPLTEKEKSGPPNPFGYGNKSVGRNGDISWLEYLLLTTGPEFDYEKLASVSAQTPENFR